MQSELRGRRPACRRSACSAPQVWQATTVEATCPPGIRLSVSYSVLEPRSGNCCTEIRVSVAFKPTPTTSTFDNCVIWILFWAAARVDERMRNKQLVSHAKNESGCHPNKALLDCGRSLSPSVLFCGVLGHFPCGCRPTPPAFTGVFPKRKRRCTTVPGETQQQGKCS